MPEPRTTTALRQDAFFNERLARLNRGRNHNLDWGGNPQERRAAAGRGGDPVREMIGTIDLANLNLTPHRGIGVKYNRYRVSSGGREYELQLLQPINRTSKRYDVSIMGGDEVEYADSIDLSRTSVQDAKAYLQRIMKDYIKKWK